MGRDSALRWPGGQSESSSEGVEEAVAGWCIVVGDMMCWDDMV